MSHTLHHITSYLGRTVKKTLKIKKTSKSWSPEKILYLGGKKRRIEKKKNLKKKKKGKKFKK